MVGTRADALQNSLNFEGKNSVEGLNIKDSLVNIDDILSGNNYMQLKLEERDGEKNNEDEEEFDLDLNF